MDCSPSGSSVHGILQARILDWVAIFSFNESYPCSGPTCISEVESLILHHLGPAKRCYHRAKSQKVINNKQNQLSENITVTLQKKLKSKRMHFPLSLLEEIISILD